MNHRKQQSPQVSVGVPVFNAEVYLEAAIHSIQRQTLDDIEIIVSDNCSTDRTSEIILDTAASDPRIHYMRQETNRGAAANYNLVFKRSRAPYFRWVAADDMLAPNLLARCVANLEGEPEAVLAYPKTELIDAADSHVSFYDDNLDLRQSKLYQRAGAFVRRVSLCNAALGVHRSDVLRKTHLIQPFQGSDAVLLFEIALHGMIHEIDEPLFQRRVHKGASLETNRSSAAIQAWFDPSASVPKLRLPPRLRLLLGYLQVLHEFPADRADRFLTTASVLGVWTLRRARVNLGRLRRRLASAGGSVLSDERFPEFRKQ